MTNIHRIGDFGTNKPSTTITLIVKTKISKNLINLFWCTHIVWIKTKFNLRLYLGFSNKYCHF
jgi:hypothetical protein